MFLLLKNFLLFLILVAWLFCIIDALRKERSYGWVILLIFFGPLGPLVYLLNFFVLDWAGWRRFDTAIQDHFEAQRLERELEANEIPGHRLDLARIRYQQGRYADCLLALKPALDADPDDVRGQFMAGSSLLETNRPVEAIPHLEYVTGVEPDFDFGEGMLTLALAYEKAGREANAVEAYRAVLKKCRRADAVVRKAYLLINRGEIEEAREDLNAVIRESRGAPGFGRRAERQWIARARSLLARLPAAPNEP